MCLIRYMQSLHLIQVAHRAGVYPSFFSMKQQRVITFYSLLDGLLVHHRVTPSIKVFGTNLYTWVEGGTVGVKILVHEQNTMSPDRG